MKDIHITPNRQTLFHEMKTRHGRKKWREADVARYLLANIGYDQWKAENDDVVVWITSDGTEMYMMDDDDDRAAAVDRFIRNRGAVTRLELVREFEGAGDALTEQKPTLR